MFKAWCHILARFWQSMDLEEGNESLEIISSGERLEKCRQETKTRLCFARGRMRNSEWILQELAL